MKWEMMFSMGDETKCKRIWERILLVNGSAVAHDQCKKHSVGRSSSLPALTLQSRHCSSWTLKCAPEPTGSPAAKGLIFSTWRRNYVHLRRRPLRFQVQRNRLEVQFFGPLCKCVRMGEKNVVILKREKNVWREIIYWYHGAATYSDHLVGL